jgi:fibronectin-binding autotransporter adhesin
MISHIKVRISSSRIALVAAVFVASLSASAQVTTNYFWQGDLSTNWATAGNWAGGTAPPTGGVYSVRLDVTNRANSPLFYTAAQGDTTYANTNGRGLVIASGADGSMYITGGSFSTLGSTSPDIIANNAIGNLVILGGSFTSGTFDFGANSSGTGTLIVSNGLATIFSLRFNMGSGGNARINLDGGVLAIGTITNGGNLAGNETLTFNGGTLRAATNVSTFNNVMNGAYIRTNGAIIDTGTNAMIIAQALLHATNAGEAAIDGGLRKTGTGTLTLTSTNGYTGVTVIEAGALQLGNGSAVGGSIGTGNITNNGLLIFNRDTNITIANFISGNGGVTLSTGMVTLTSSNTYSGGTTIRGNTTLQLGNGGAVGGIGTGNITNNGVLIFNRLGHQTNANLISGSGSIIKVAASTNILTGGNTFDGTVMVSNGALRIEHAQALGSTLGGTLTGAGGGAVQLAGGITVINETITLQTNVAASLVFGGLHSVEGSNAWTGNVVLNGPDIRLGASGTSILNISGVISNGAGFANFISRTDDGATLVISGTNNTYSGLTRVYQGNLQLGAHNALATGTVLSIGNSSVVNAHFNLGGFNQEFTGLENGNLHAGHYITNSSATLSTLFLRQSTGAVYSYGNRLVGNLAVALVGGGTQVLSGTNSHTGDTIVSNGVLAVSGVYALGATNGGTIVADGARLQLRNVAITNETLALSGTGNGHGALQGFSGATNTWAGNVLLTADGAQVSANTNTVLRITGGIDDGASTFGLVSSNAAGATTVLAGVNTHDGATTVRGAGRTEISGSLVGGVTVEQGATLLGEGSTAGALVFSGTNTFLIDALTPGAFSANTVTANGNAINIGFAVPTAPTNGILVFSAASAFSATLDQFEFVGRGDLEFAAGDTQLILNYSGPVGALLWQGTAANATFWDNHITTNWLATSAEKFYSYDEVIFDDSATTFEVAVQGGSVLPASVIFSNSANAYVVGGGAIAGTGTVTMAGANVTTLSGSNAYSGATVISSGVLRAANNGALGSTAAGTTVAAGGRLGLTSNITVTGETLTLSGDGNGGGALLSDGGSNRWAGGITLAADSQIGGAASAVLAVSGAITDSTNTFGLVISNASSGATILSGANTFDGGVRIDEGTVYAANLNALGTGGVTNNATLNLSLYQSGTLTYSGISTALSGTGVVNVTLFTNNSAVNLNGNYSGYSGTLNIGTAAAALAPNLVGKVNLNGVLGSGASVNVASNATVYMSVGITQQASLVLNGGDLSEQYGQLRLDNGATWAGAITLAGAITGTNLDGHIGNFAGTGFILGPIGEANGSQDLVKVGGNTLVLGGSNSFSGATLVRQGALRITNAFALGAVGGGVDVVSGARLELGGDITVAGEVATIRGSGGNNFGALQTQSGTNTWAGDVLIDAAQTRVGANAGTLVISGAIGDGTNVYDLTIRNNNGTTVLSGQSTYQGTTFVLVGTTRLENGDNRLPTGTIVQIGVSGTGGATLDLFGGNQEIAGLISAAGLSPSLMHITNSNPSGVTNVLVVNSAQDTAYAGTIDGAIAVVKSGANTLTLSGTSTYYGETTVSNGTLVVNGQLVGTPQVLVGNGGTLAGTGTVGLTIIDNGGHLAPGTSPGILKVTNSLTLNPTSQLDFEIGAITNARSYYDVVQVSGTPGDLVLDGVLNVSNWAGGFGATSGTNVYALFDYTGTLSDNGVELGTAPSNLAYRVQTDVPGRVDLSVKEFAQPSFTNDSIATTLVLDFGIQTQSFSSNVLAFSIFSFDTNAVRLALSLTNFDAALGPFWIAGTNFAGLGGGSNQLFSAIMDLSTAGVYSNSFTFSFTSTADGYLWNDDPSRTLTVTILGEVQIPEPGASLALLAALGLTPRRRRTRA